MYFLNSKQRCGSDLHNKEREEKRRAYFRHFGVWGTVSSGFLKADATEFLMLLAFDMNLLLKDLESDVGIALSTQKYKKENG